jgi:hypothetical protein
LVQFLNFLVRLTHLSKWSHQLALHAIPITLLNFSFSSVDKSRVMPLWNHIPFWGYQTLPSSVGKDWQVQAFASTSSFPSLKWNLHRFTGVGKLCVGSLAHNLPYSIIIELKVGESKINYRKFRRTNLDDGCATLIGKTPKIPFAWIWDMCRLQHEHLY